MSMIEIIIERIIKKSFKLIGKECSEVTIRNVIQFVKFGIVGVSNTLVGYALYAVCLLLFKKLSILTDMDYIIAQTVSFLLSVLWSFYWNNKFVFTLQENQRRDVIQALLKSYASYSFTGLFLNNILLILWVRVLEISEFIAPFFSLMISAPINFLLNKFWAFKAHNQNSTK